MRTLGSLKLKSESFTTPYHHLCINPGLLSLRHPADAPFNHSFSLVSTSRGNSHTYILMVERFGLQRVRTQAALLQSLWSSQLGIQSKISMKIQENLLREPIQKHPHFHLAVSAFSFPETHIYNDMPQIFSKNGIWVQFKSHSS